MNEGLISKRYAKALYEYAETIGEESILYERMKMLTDILRGIPKLRGILRSPMIPSTYKKEILEDATGNTPEQSYLDFVRLVTDNHREGSVQSIALSYQTLYRKRKNISVVKITSVVPMTETALERIQKQVSARTNGDVEFSNQIDMSIGGGFIFQLDDIRMDASVKGQLDRLRRKLQNGN